MNNTKKANDTRVLEYQANKLQELISELHNCCKERYTHEAKAFRLPQVMAGASYTTWMGPLTELTPDTATSSSL